MTEEANLVLPAIDDLRAELAGRALDRMTSTDRQALAGAVPALLRFAAQLERGTGVTTATRDGGRRAGNAPACGEAGTTGRRIYGGGAAARPDADGGTACLAHIARTGAPRGAAPPHSVTIQVC